MGSNQPFEDMQQNKIALGHSFAPVIKTINTAAIAVSLDGRICCASAPVAELFEETEDDFLDGKMVFDFLSTGDRHRCNGMIDAVVLNDISTVEDEIHLNLHHNDKHFMFSVKGLIGEDGTVYGFILQPPAVQALQLPALMDSAIEHGGHAMWEFDLLTDKASFSPHWYKMRGLDPKDAGYEDLREFAQRVHPDDRDKTLAKIADLAKPENVELMLEFRERHAEGHYFWVMTRGSVTKRAADGRPIRYVGTDTDITELKQVELDYRRESERLGVALQAADMGRWEYNLRANRTFWDDRLLDIFGIEDGNNWREANEWANLIHPEDREQTLFESESSLQNKGDYLFKYRIVRPDGGIRHLHSRAKFVDDPRTGEGMVGVNIDVTEDVLRAKELEDARVRLEYESHHDALTGLANRRGLDQKQDALRAAGRVSREAVLHFDLDNFKQINDTLGHPAGDAVLVHAADILRKQVRDDWIAARVGGDEFVMLLPDAPDRATLADLAEKIINDMSAPFYVDGHLCNFGVSIGIARSDEQHDKGSSLFVNADLALYDAKQEGRGRYRFFNTRMKRMAADRKEAFDSLLAGFEREEIICHYQPQFDAETLKLTGLEALVRWQSPTRGLLTPDAFLRTAEEMGLIAELDARVLDLSCRDLKTWSRQGYDVPRVSVNVSAARLADPGLIDGLRAMDLPYDKLSFELLESAFLDNADTVLDNNLDELSNLGIEVEIDDFGTGHASIVSLLRVAPKRLKIDRQLVDPIIKSRKQRRLLKTIVDIGKMQGVQVVAEGVETAKHAVMLRTLGCDFLQGYALARPMPASEITQMLDSLGETCGVLQI